MLNAVRREVSERLSEVFLLVDYIRRIESAPPTPDPQEAKILRGLFYVHLYAALEFTVANGVRAFLDAVNGLNVQTLHLQPHFFSITLDSGFNSARSVGDEKRWTSRLKLIEQQSSLDPKPINSDVFGLFLQNAWPEKIETLFSCLGIAESIIPPTGSRLFIDELVEHRNGVAHGRFSALGLGSARRSPDLLIRFNAVSATCIHILDCLEQHFNVRGWVLPPHRNTYL